MVFENLLKRDIPEDINSEEYLEVNVADAGPARVAAVGTGKMSIKIEKLTDFADTDRVLKAVREGAVVFLKIKALKEKDMGELKRCVERLKKTLMAQNGDIVGIEQDWLLLAPEFVVVHR